MTNHVPYMIMGSLLGALHGLILWAAIQTLGFASWIVYKDKYLVPIQITLVIDIVIVIIVASAVWWLPKLEKFFLGD